MEPIVNKTAYLLTILTEESAEILKEFLFLEFDNSKEIKDRIQQESFELIAVSELLEKEGVLLKNIVNYKTIVNDYEFKIELTNLIYFISKSIRFSLKDKHPELNNSNQVELSKIIISIEQYIFTKYNLSLYLIESIKEDKKNKVNKFFDYSLKKGMIL